MAETCHLCLSQDTTRQNHRKYELVRCNVCDLVFVPFDKHLSRIEEERRYELHENSIEDPGYVDFLRQLITPIEKSVPNGSHILDYGSGPEPVLAKLLRCDGYHVDIYDPFFAPEKPQGAYSAITLSEVIEHFAHPREELEVLKRLLEPNGVLGIMTLRHTKNTDLETWHYVQDPTHVAFFSDTTFQWIERVFGFKRIFDDENRVVLLEKYA